MIPELFTPVQRLSFNRRCVGPRKVAWAEFPMDDINAVREPCGAKVNDVAMLVLTGAIRRYARLHRQTLKGRLLRLMAPVNLRKDAQNPGLGNMISILPVNIPLDVDDPVELLQIIHDKTETLKRAHVPEMIILATSCLGIAPASVQALAFGIVGNDLPIPLFNMVCTNVAGPTVPLYALGRKMLTYYPYVPIGSQMGACCAIASYNGTLYFGLTGDSASAPDLSRMRDFLYEAFQELQAAVGLAPVQKKKRARRVVKSRERKVVAAVAQA
jgi:WS/DGAT/MGAT family acyltransferase